MKPIPFSILVASLVVLAGAGPEVIGPEDPYPRAPVRITVSDNDNLLYITDYDINGVITVKARDLRPKHAFLIEGRPGGIAQLDGALYVGNKTTQQIEIYNLRGKSQGILGGPDSYIGDPMDFAVDESRGLLFAVDGVEKNIQVWDLNTSGGQLVAQIGEPGEVMEMFQHPTGIAIDPTAQEIFVADYGEIERSLYPRIMIFSYNGTFQRYLSGKAGMMGYRFSKPQGLAVDDANHIFIVEAWQGKVVVIDRTSGSPVAEIGEYGYEPGQMRLPLDLVIVGDDKDMYITNNRTGRIEAFPEGGQIP